MKKKELLKRIEALESIVKPIAELQKAEKNAKELEEKKELEAGKWYKCKGEDLFITYNDTERYGIDCDGNWFEGESLLTGFYRGYYEATPQEVEEALIKETKKRYKVGDKLRDVNEVDIVPNGDYVFKDGVLYYGGATVMKDGKWAEIVEEKQYTPKIGDVFKAWEEEDSEDFIIGKITKIDYDNFASYPYYVSCIWCLKVEPITDENIIKLFN